MKIRSAEESDLSRIAKLEQEIFSDPWSKKSLLDTYLQPNTFLLVAEQDEKIEGYVIIYYVLDEGEVARIAVSEEFRREGVAASLLEEAKKICQERNIALLLLEVRSLNLPALALYERFGFKKDGVRKAFYTEPTDDAVLMSANLS